MSEKFSLEILSPESLIIKTDVKQVVIPSFEGEIGILKNHIPLITFLRPGLINIKGSMEIIFFAEDGTVEFVKNNLLILTSTAYKLSEISETYIEQLLNKSETDIINAKLSDKEKYLLSHKIETLKNINL